MSESSVSRKELVFELAKTLWLSGRVSTPEEAFKQADEFAQFAEDHERNIWGVVPKLSPETHQKIMEANTRSSKRNALSDKRR